MAAVSKDLETQVEHIKYSRDVIHSYSKAVKLLYNLALSYVYDAEEAYRRGKNAVWAWGNTEAPLFYACDAIPVAFTELGRLGSPDAMSVAEDYYQIPREACSMVKMTIGEWHLHKGGIRKILGNSASCEPYNIIMEIIKKEGYDVHTVDTIYRPPQMDEERYRHLEDFYVNELRETAEWISGKPLDEDKLEREIRRRNRYMHKVRRIMELRLQHPTYIRSLATMFLLMGSGHYFGKPDEYEEVLDRLLEEMSALGPEPADQVVPLVWSGARGQEFGVYQAIDEAGGAILGWMIPTPYEKDYEEGGDPLRSLVRYQLQGYNAGATSYRCIGLERHVKHVKAKGIVLYGYVGCSFSGIDRELQREYFRKRGVPSISLDGTFQVGPPSGQLITRVKAFVEMLS